MDGIVIQGGVPLRGEVTVSGAKNAVLPLMASALLGAETCLFRNVPQVVDVTTMGKLLRILGADVTASSESLAVTATHLTSTEAPYDLVRTMRASVLVLGPLVARYGEAKVSLPGGCAIGARPVNLHLAGLEKLGAEIAIEHGYIRAKAGRLRGGRIHLDLPSVTGTENLLMAACLAEGTTVIENAAKEPEVVDLAAFLVKRGAKIEGAGSGVIHIEGVPSLRGADHEVIPDRIETGTYLVAGAITGGDLTVRACRPEHLEAVLVKLRETGAEVTEGKEWIRLRAPGRLTGVDIETFPYPGFPTDMQAQMMALLCVVRGASVITETVFEGRLMHVPELQRMGADIRVRGHHAVVEGKPHLTGAAVMASDLRASAGLIVAGLAADGETSVARVYHLDRGYERLEEKLRGLGARIERRKDASGTTAGRPAC